MRVTIEVTAGPARGRVFNIDHADLFIVGRARDSRIALPNDPYLSRQHFVVEVCPPNCKITDLGSKNGTFVNGLRYGGRKTEANIKQAPQGELLTVIQNGEIVVGDTRLKVHCVKRPTPAPAAPSSNGLPVSDGDASADTGLQPVTSAGLAERTQSESPLQPGTIQLQDDHYAVPAPGAKLDPPAADDRTLVEAPPANLDETAMRGDDEAPQHLGDEHLQCAFCGKECAGEVRALARITGAEYVCHACRANRAFAQRERQPKPPVPSLSPQTSRLAAQFKAGGRNSPHANLVFPGYTVLDIVGSGGMGVVYKAVRESDGLVVAIKSLLPNVPVSFENYRIFHREIELSRQLKHPNIVTVLDHGRVKGAYFCVMEFVDGLSLKDFIHQMGGIVPLKQAAPLMLDILSGLAAAHHAQIETRAAGPRMISGIVHRDLKPENILLKRDAFGWTPKIADFGIAKNFEAAGMTDMTIAGVCGTPTYWPREQLTHYRYLHPATDVFSIAAVFFEMLTGKCARPGMQETLVQFQRRSQSPALADFMRVIGSNPIPQVREVVPSLPAPIAAVLDKALQEVEVPLDEVEMRETLQLLRYPDAGVFREELAKAFKLSHIEL